MLFNPTKLKGIAPAIQKLADRQHVVSADHAGSPFSPSGYTPHTPYTPYVPDRMLQMAPLGTTLRPDAVNLGTTTTEANGDMPHPAATGVPHGHAFDTPVLNGGSSASHEPTSLQSHSKVENLNNGVPPVNGVAHGAGRGGLEHLDAPETGRGGDMMPTQTGTEATPNLHAQSQP